MFDEGGEQRTYSDPLNHPDINSADTPITDNGGALGVNIEAQKNPDVNIVFFVDQSGSVGNAFERDMDQDVIDFVDRNPDYYSYAYVAHFWESCVASDTPDNYNSASEFKTWAQNNMVTGTHRTDCYGRSFGAVEHIFNNHVDPDAENYVIILTDGDDREYPSGQNQSGPSNTYSNSDFEIVEVFFDGVRTTGPDSVGVNDVGFPMIADERADGTKMYYNNDRTSFTKAFDSIQENQISKGKIRFGLRSKNEEGRFRRDRAYGFGTGFSSAIWDDGSGPTDTDQMIWVR